MRRELAEARTLAETKAGEIAIIRSKQARMAEEYDRQLAALRKAMADRETTHKEAVDAAMSEGKMLATENLNGRQIRNTITTARQIALFRKVPLGYSHFEQTIRIANDFEA